MFLHQYTSNLYKLYKPSEGKDKEANVKNLCDGLEVMEQELTKRGKPKYFGGNELKFIDYMIWPWVERLPGLELLDRIQVPWDKYPLVVRQNAMEVLEFANSSIFFASRLLGLRTWRMTQL